MSCFDPSAVIVMQAGQVISASHATTVQSQLQPQCTASHATTVQSQLQPQCTALLLVQLLCMPPKRLEWQAVLLA